MNKSRLLLTAAIVAINPACLFAGQDMITSTSRTTVKCEVRIYKCEAETDHTDPPYLRFKDYTSFHGPIETCIRQGDPSFYYATRFFVFKDYPSSQKTVEELIAFIQEKLNRVSCPRVDLTFDDSTGDINVGYVHSGCEWSINVRDIKPEDFVWKQTRDSFSARLGYMERRKFHCASEQDAQDIESAFTRICVINAWTPSKY